MIGKSINFHSFDELPNNLQERIKSCMPDETGYIAHTFICPHCDSPAIIDYEIDDEGNHIYKCEDCESIINESDLILI